MLPEYGGDDIHDALGVFSAQGQHGCQPDQARWRIEGILDAPFPPVSQAPAEALEGHVGRDAFQQTIVGLQSGQVLLECTSEAQAREPPQTHWPRASFQIIDKNHGAHGAEGPLQAPSRFSHLWRGAGEGACDIPRTEPRFRAGCAAGNRAGASPPRRVPRDSGPAGKHAQVVADMDRAVQDTMKAQGAESMDRFSASCDSWGTRTKKS